MRINELKNMSLEEVSDVVRDFPWFGAARRIMCEKLSSLGGVEWGNPQFADAALYVGSRSVIASLLRKRSAYSDKDVAELIRKYMDKSARRETVSKADNGFRGVGDYFSREQYAGVRQEGGEWMHRFSFDENLDEVAEPAQEDPMTDFCTETLAQIYAEQGYFDKAADIYSKLILAYPEKSVYFAALIEKLSLRNKN